MNRVLFIPQLSSHFESLNLVSQNLIKGGSSCEVLNLGNIFGYQFSGGIRMPIAEVFGYSYYDLVGYRRYIVSIALLILNRSFLKRLISDYDSIVVFSEPMLVRYIINEARKKGCITHLIMEGMRSNNELELDKWHYLSLAEVKEQVKLRILRYSCRLRGTWIDPFIPGLNGSSNVDYIYPIGQYSLDIVSSINRSNARILNWGIPKYDKYASVEPGAPEVGSSKEVNHIFYYASAFAWHNKFELEECQTLDILMLCRQVVCFDNLKLRIFIHPKGDVDIRIIKYVKENPDKIFLDSSKNLVNEGREGDLIFSSISTVIVEFKLINIQVIPIMISFNKALFSNSFIHHLDCNVIEDVEELISIISNIDNNFSQKIDKFKNEVIFNKGNSASLIADNILGIVF
jgi:hypothetical protein